MIPAAPAADTAEMPMLPEIPEHFSVRDENSANWVIRQIVERRAYAKRCEEWCEREQTRALREEEFFLFRYGRELMNFARHRIEQHSRRKSVNLPAGSLCFRKVPSRIIVDDEAAVITWAKVHKPNLVIVTERLDKRSLITLVESTGEIPDAGVHVEPERENFYLR